MARIPKMNNLNELRPSIGEIEEAKHHPDGWVYRISDEYDPKGAIPPEAIIGAWKVDGSGKIDGEFIPNPNYKSS